MFVSDNSFSIWSYDFSGRVTKDKCKGVEDKSGKNKQVSLSVCCLPLQKRMLHTLKRHFSIQLKQQVPVLSCIYVPYKADPTLMRVQKEFSFTVSGSKAKTLVIYGNKSRLPHVEAQFLSR